MSHMESETIFFDYKIPREIQIVFRGMKDTPSNFCPNNFRIEMKNLNFFREKTLVLHTFKEIANGKKRKRKSI
jgi:hypothetical protein